VASIRREFLIDARPEEVWDAVSDLGALHTRLAPASSPTASWKRVRAW